MTIVELSAADVESHLDALAQLLLDAHETGMALGLAAPLTIDSARAAYENTAERLSQDRILLAAFDDDELVGAVQLSRADAGNGRHRAEVQRLVVRGDHRGRGVGRALMEAVVDEARKRELKLLWLTTHADTAADRIYERLGWSRAGVIPDYAELPNGELAANAFFYVQLR
ncbi:MAG TPA: GNAT family N-acetyltransferase [Gaiellaceae bacterium]|nr:GNAT family N-acetyltransferase [Gaiellaceae bacterium]